MRSVDIQEAEANLSELIDALERGEETEIVILRDGKPVARLLPPTTVLKPDTSKRLGLMEGKYPSMSQEEFDADNDEIAKVFYGEDE